VYGIRETGLKKDRGGPEKSLIFPWPALINHISGDPISFPMENFNNMEEFIVSGKFFPGNSSMPAGRRGIVQQ
jgi:hypothetical protein